MQDHHIKCLPLPNWGLIERTTNHGSAWVLDSPFPASVQALSITDRILDASPPEANYSITSFDHFLFEELASFFQTRFMDVVTDRLDYRILLSWTGARCSRTESKERNILYIHLFLWFEQVSNPSSWKCCSLPWTVFSNASWNKLWLLNGIISSNCGNTILLFSLLIVGFSHLL